ncbi:nuclear transport factor 2 family protein [Acidiferrimicrobium sp. IK]|uniref:nuclear transport factor 2 family protein n=1 Tax=Acidiferrimicrobium sp. IK TaxID=2871700 RepID=UPI0021CB08C2|nr:nuclear transport factor 2 family protein [Acidiferrimicrobium sp. IK]MCU4186793.1 nuclear transport factor 2 family protein [Acidiferrimicrobium sp. IK]
MTDDLLARIDRLESRESIRQLVSRYGVLIDARDLDALTSLFVEDARVTRTERGRSALRALLEGLCRQFTTSIHFVGNQTVDFTDPDHAEGVVYCRAEHEVGAQWIVMAIQYWDRYERRDGTWYFTGRKVKHWYAADMLDRPVGPDKTRWATPGAEATIPTDYPSWDRFWAEVRRPS